MKELHNSLRGLINTPRKAVTSPLNCHAANMLPNFRWKYESIVAYKVK